MKRFVETFFICLVVVEVLFFFGGGLLFDLSRHYYGAGAGIAFFLTVLIRVLTEQSDKIEALEKRIQSLETMLETTKDSSDKEKNP